MIDSAEFKPQNRIRVVLSLERRQARTDQSSTVRYFNNLAPSANLLMALLSVPADERLNPDHPHHEPSTIYSESLAAQGLPRFELGGDEMPGRDVAQYM